MQSDAVMLAGVLNVLKSAGKLKPRSASPSHIFLVSIDGTPLALEQIREGQLDAAISQPLDLYVKYGAHYLQDAVAGKTFAAGPTDHDSRSSMFNGNPMDLLPAPTVTKANVDDPALWGNQVEDEPMTARSSERAAGRGSREPASGARPSSRRSASPSASAPARRCRT